VIDRAKKGLRHFLIIERKRTGNGVVTQNKTHPRAKKDFPRNLNGGGKKVTAVISGDEKKAKGRAADGSRKKKTSQYLGVQDHFLTSWGDPRTL